jgi:hypothetical protein
MLGRKPTINLKEALGMKSKLLTMFVVATLLLSVFVGSASAQAYNAHFTTSITYVNVGAAATTTLDLLFYASADDTTPTMYALDNLEPNAAGSLFVGSLGDDVVPAGFKGDAIMQSDQPMLVTLVQIPQNAGNVKNRALSNGFSAGAPQALIATVLKNTFNTNTIFSIQNADSELNTVEISFYDTSAHLVHSMTQDIEAGAPFYVDAGQLAGLGAAFNGSAVVMATRADDSDGSIVSSAMELEITTIGLKAFEGVSSGGLMFYMPSALCKAFGGSDTSYAVQNTSLTTDTDVVVTYTDNNGDVTTDSATIGPGAKASFVACNAMAVGTYGAAVIEADPEPVVAIGKAYGLGITTAFNGVDMGYTKIGLPYVRWATDANWAAGLGQRTNITIQNVGTDLAAGDVIKVEYVGPAGDIKGTHNIVVPAGGLANGAKVNSNPSNAGLTEFGFYGTVYGGAAIITGPEGSELAAVARVSTQTSANVFVSEDYNSQPIP